MTDAVANGPVETPTTAQSESTVIPAQGSNGETGIKVAGPLVEDNRALVEAKKWAGDDGSMDLNKVLEAYRNLESHVGKSVVVPGEGATAEEWNAFYTKLGRPPTPNDYTLQFQREGVPENFPYSEADAVEFRNWAHELGLSPKQAQGLHDKFIGKQAGMFSGMAEQQVQRETSAHRQIVDTWGEPETEGYKQKVEFASRAINQLGLREALVEGGMLSKDGAILNAKTAFAMARVGREMFGEDSFGDNPGGQLNNPFQDGSNFNLTKQGQILRSDPKKASSLIRAAGKSPKDFGIT